jgi:hypothetical protein
MFRAKSLLEYYTALSRLAIVVLVLLIASNSVGHAMRAEPLRSSPSTQFAVVVLDSESHTPLQLARVSLMRGTSLVQGHVTDVSGQAIFRDVYGNYTLVVRSVGYRPYSQPITVLDQSIVDTVLLSLVQQNEVVVTSNVIPNVSVDLSSGNQVFDASTYHAPPQDRITALVQQSVAGAARAPTGEVHVRGQHGEFTYYLDGIPVPLGVFGGLNEVVDPQVIDRVTFLTGGFPAEYGGQMAAVMDVQTKVPEGSGFHLNASEYTGTYLPNIDKASQILPNRFLNSDGQTLAISDHTGPLSFYLSGSRQETDRRIDPPVPLIFHDHGFDYFLYGKADYILSPTSYLSMNLNYGVTATQVPYDSLEGIASDYQTATNSFQTLSYFNTLSTETEHEQHLFIGAYAREGGLVYTPGSIDPPGFVFASDTSKAYNLAEDRSFTTLGTRVKYDASLSHQVQYAIGGNFSATTGHENFTSADSAGNAGPSVFSNFAGSDFGLFVQGQYHPLEWTRFDVGVRYDQHIAPDLPFTSQVCPRIKWNFFIDESNTAYLYYGSIFMPNNTEGLRTIASASQGSNVPQGTLPERDKFYEAVYSRSWGYGVTSKLAAFYKFATPGVDDATIGSSALKTPVNIDTVRTTGLELALSFSDPNSPFSGYVNTSIIHAYGAGTITGGFLPFATDGTATDLDHDQRLSVVIGANYQPQDWFVNGQAIYGSGLTNGNPNGLPIQTGLFNFNQGAHTTPSWIINVSGGYTFHIGNETLTPSLYITNLLDYHHLIKGAYFSNAVWEEPRNVVLRVSFHI